MLHTAAIWRPGDHQGVAIDVTVKSALPEHKDLAPTWDLVMASKRGQITWAQYTEAYVGLLRERWNTQPLLRLAMVRLALQAVREDVTLLCYCRDPRTCHRTLLAGVLQKIARSQGAELGVRLR